MENGLAGEWFLVMFGMAVDGSVGFSNVNSRSGQKESAQEDHLVHLFLLKNKYRFWHIHPININPNLITHHLNKGRLQHKEPASI